MMITKILETLDGKMLKPVLGRLCIPYETVHSKKHQNHKKPLFFLMKLFFYCP